MIVSIYQIFVFLISYCYVYGFNSSPWHYECSHGFCQKEKITRAIVEPKSLELCQLTCGEYGPFWPRPTGPVILGTQTVFVNYKNITLGGVDAETVVGNFLNQFIEKIQKRMKRMLTENSVGGGYAIKVNISLKHKQFSKFTFDTDESYKLKVEQLGEGIVSVTITADNYYGARHALETMNQLIVFDDTIDEMRMLADVTVNDRPKYPYRGIMLDVASNFIEKSAVIRTIEAMAMSKMNTLHLRLTDSKSFPYYSRNYPLMSYYGAYTPSKVYSPIDVQEIVEFGYLYGVRVIPEFSAPAHVGEGWQWVEDDVITCFKATPRYEFCAVPPCGQLNPINLKTYDILAGIYTDLLNDFEPVMFHMSGNDVNFNCWNASANIQNWMLKHGMDLTKDNFRLLWDQYQTSAYDTLVEANNYQKIPVILWQSDLVDPKYMRTIDPNKYTIQITSKTTAKSVGRIIKHNFTVILSNYDYLYLDCGFASWIDEGNNWCSPYKGWHHIYEYSAKEIFRIHKIPNSLHKLVLGSEAVLWSDQADGLAVDMKLWPRTAALAERLWSDPESSWEEAEQRFLRHRERLTSIGIFADSQSPEWCLRNQGQCSE